jgi:plasmid stabilization system protein ParE
MSRPYALTLDARAARQVQRERVWLIDNLSVERADAFEAELRHALELLAECPEMGAPSRWGKDERAVFLRRSRFHVFYLVNHGRQEIRVTRIRHEARRL